MALINGLRLKFACFCLKSCLHVCLISRGDRYSPLCAWHHAQCHPRDDDLTSNHIRQRLSNSNKEVLKLVPVIDFIADIVRRNHVACQAVLEGGFFDMLLRIYVAFPTFYKYNAEEKSCQSAMFTACQSAFKALSVNALYAEIVRSHPVYDLWLRVDQLSSQDVSTTSEESLPDRCAAWRKTEAHLVKRRLMIIWSASTLSADNDAEFLVCADVVEFSR
jgi:hypothetical protein